MEPKKIFLEEVILGQLRGLKKDIFERRERLKEEGLLSGASKNEFKKAENLFCLGYFEESIMNSVLYADKVLRKEILNSEINNQIERSVSDILGDLEGVKKDGKTFGQTIKYFKGEYSKQKLKNNKLNENIILFEKLNKIRKLFIHPIFWEINNEFDEDKRKLKEEQISKNILKCFNVYFEIKSCWGNKKKAEEETENYLKQIPIKEENTNFWEIIKKSFRINRKVWLGEWFKETSDERLFLPLALESLKIIKEIEKIFK